MYWWFSGYYVYISNVYGPIKAEIFELMLWGSKFIEMSRRPC